MFKRYTFYWRNGESTEKAIFYVHRKARRGGGFIHRAIVTGAIPRLDESSIDFAQYQRNNEKLEKMSLATMRFIPGRRTFFEHWQGRWVLGKLWNQLAELPFTDMMAIGPNPFDTQKEPEHEDLIEPELLFG